MINRFIKPPLELYYVHVKNFRQRVIVPAECVTVHAQCMLHFL